MAKFKFKAIDAKGTVYKGVKESKDKFSLYAELKLEGETLISTIELGKKKPLLDFKSISLFDHVPEHEKITFSKSLGAMIDAGLPLAKGLSIMERQIKNRKFKSVIATIEEEIRKGKTLSEAAGAYPKVFTNLFVAMVKAGEESGKLSESLKLVGDQMEGMYNLKKKIRGAMIYPGVILTVMLTVGILMLIFVVPGITATFKSLNVELPFLTKLLITVSDFLETNILIAVVGFLGIIFALYSFSLSKMGKNFYDFVLIKMPIIGGLVKETNSARITRTISSLLSSGVPFAEAILITGEVIQNKYYKEVLNESRVKVEKGETISSVFLARTDVCPEFVGEMMNVGEETGRLPAMLLEVALYYENLVDQKTKDMSTIIEPFLMVFIGAAVGFFAIAMIKPIYSIMDTI